jgi:hypothetical protein
MKMWAITYLSRVRQALQAHPDRCIAAGLFLVSLVYSLTTYSPLLIRGDDVEYLTVMKSMVERTLLDDIHSPEREFFLFRPFGYPILLGLFYPILGARWAQYVLVPTLIGALLPALVFIWLRTRMAIAAAVGLALGVLCNPVLAKMQGVVYSDVPYTVGLLAFVILWERRPRSSLVPLMALGLLTLRTAGVVVPGAYLLACISKRDWRGVATMAFLIVTYMALNGVLLGEVPGFARYTRLIASNFSGEPVVWTSRIVSNMRGILGTLLPSSLLFFTYGLFPPSALKLAACGLGSGALIGCAFHAYRRCPLHAALIAGHFLMPHAASCVAAATCRLAAVPHPSSTYCFPDIAGLGAGRWDSLCSCPPFHVQSTHV